MTVSDDQSISTVLAWIMQVNVFIDKYPVLATGRGAFAGSQDRARVADDAGSKVGVLGGGKLEIWECHGRYEIMYISMIYINQIPRLPDSRGW